MTTVTIPKELARKGDLVIIPRREYEVFSRWKKTVKTKKRQTALDRSLAIALREVKEGKTFGPFDTAEKLMKSLQSDS